MNPTHAEHAPDIRKREYGRHIMGECDDKTNSEDRKRHHGLDEYRHGACKHARYLWGEHVPRDCAHSNDSEADHRGDDDIQARA